MKRILLYSRPGEKNFDKILQLTFPEEISNKTFAYMPSDGANSPQEYTDFWKKIAKERDAHLLFVDNSKIEAKDEIDKLMSANILLITGGNTFTLLRNLKRSGLDKAIIDFSKKDEFVLSGFSAGALVLSRTIQICNLPNFDENLVGLKDLLGLNIIDFEVFPHYSDELKKALEVYKKTTKNEVKKISDDEYILIDK